MPSGESLRPVPVPLSGPEGTEWAIATLTPAPDQGLRFRLLRHTLGLGAEGSGTAGGPMRSIGLLTGMATLAAGLAGTGWAAQERVTVFESFLHPA